MNQLEQRIKELNSRKYKKEDLAEMVATLEQQQQNSECDLETAKRVVAANYPAVILADEDLSKSRVYFKGESLHDLSNARLYMGPKAGVNLSVQQVYTPTPSMIKANVAATKKISQLMGERHVVHKDIEQSFEHFDSDEWECECGEINKYSHSNERTKRETIQYQCGICRQWTGQKPLSAEVV